MTKPLENIEYRAYKLDAERQADAAALKVLSYDKCQLCEAEGPDMRSLYVDMFYNIKEVLPESHEVFHAGLEQHKVGYYLRICKNCRGELLDMLALWRKAMVARREIVKDEDGGDLWSGQESGDA